jgi:hypothetical protein
MQQEADNGLSRIHSGDDECFVRVSAVAKIEGAKNTFSQGFNQKVHAYHTKFPLSCITFQFSPVNGANFLRHRPQKTFYLRSRVWRNFFRPHVIAAPRVARRVQADVRDRQREIAVLLEVALVAGALSGFVRGEAVASNGFRPVERCLEMIADTFG